MEEGQFSDLPNTAKIYGGVLLIFTFICGSFGNMMNIICVLLYSKLQKKVIHFLLINMSVCGFIIDILSIPIFALHILKYWPTWHFGRTACEAVAFLTNTCTSAIVLTLFFLSIDRYYVIVKRSMIRRKTMMMLITSIGMLAACVHALCIFQANQSISVYNETISICNKLDGEVLDESSRVSTITVTLFHAILLLISLILLCNISVKWYRMKQSDLEVPLKSVGDDLKWATITTLVCFTLWLPSWILSVFRAYKKTKVKMVIISFILSLMTTCVAPITSLIFLSVIRNAFKDIFRGCKGCDLLKKDSDKPDSGRKKYDEKSRPFIKGHFKRGTKRVTMDSISIASQLTNNENRGQDNNSFDELSELHPHHESVF